MKNGLVLRIGHVLLSYMEGCGGDSGKTKASTPLLTEGTSYLGKTFREMMKIGSGSSKKDLLLIFCIACYICARPSEEMIRSKD